VQGKAEHLSDLVETLVAFYQDKLADLSRHVRHARSIHQYDANNAYQYIINREETQLGWVRRAIVELGGRVTDPADEPGTDDRTDQAGMRAIVADDARRAGEFVEGWRARVDGLANARHRKMLAVILGEVLEQQWTFDQASRGEQDLLGRRGVEVGPRMGAVRPTRWIE
jgi:hypothetical protein